jgi:heptosyltransferase-2
LYFIVTEKGNRLAPVILSTVPFDLPPTAKLMLRATNWVGDAVMSLPAVRALREAMPQAHIAMVARPWVADVYQREKAIDRVILYPKPKGIADRLAFARALRRERFDAAVLFQNAFDAAFMAWWARIPTRIGYNRDGRGFLLTSAVPVPRPGESPAHERFYYLKMLRRAGIVDRLPEVDEIRLDGIEKARAEGLTRLAALGISGPVFGLSPGAAYGNAKRWLPERFAEAAVTIANTCGALPLLFGSSPERPLCESVAQNIRSAGVDARNFAGETTLTEFISLAAACRLFLTNDSGSMHIASALSVPTVAVFGSTDHVTTGPSGPLARIVREGVDCSPCLLRECPIDHRCMTRVTTARVVETALQLWEESAARWTQETRS